MVENTSKRQPFARLVTEPVSDEFMDTLRKWFAPVYADEYVTLYRVEDKLVVGKPLETAQPQRVDDRAVTVEALHLLHDMAYAARVLYSLLKERMYEDGVRGFVGAEFKAIQDASDLLDEYRKEYLGGSWPE